MSTAVASTTTTASPPASASAAAATATVRLAAAVDKSIKTLNKRVLQLISIILDVESSLSPSSTATAPLATSPNNTTTTAADATSTAAVNEKTMLDLKAALVALLVDTQKTFLLLNEHRAWIVQSIDTRIIRGVITSLFELVSQLESSIDDILVNKDNFYPAAAPSPSQPPSHNQQLSDVGLHHPPWNPEKFISTSSTAIRTAKESTFMLKSLIAGLYAGSSAQTPQQHLVSASTTSTPPFDPSSSDTSSSTSLSTIPHLLETQQSITSSSPPSFSSDYDNLRTLLDEMTRSVEAVQASFYDLSNLLAKMGEELAAGDCLPTTIHSSLVVAHVFVKVKNGREWRLISYTHI